MTEPKRWARITGLALHVLIAAMLLFAASMKLMVTMPPEQVEELGKISGSLKLIAVGELATAILLVIPRTASLGVLVASGFWGGTICFHMSRGEPYLLQSLLLLFT
jgi:hypothetical protein